MPCGCASGECVPAYRWSCVRCDESGRCSVESSTPCEYVMWGRSGRGRGCYRPSKQEADSRDGHPMGDETPNAEAQARA